jgi:hypothetical protein
MNVKEHLAQSHEHWQQMAECAKAAGLDDMAKVCTDRATHYGTLHTGVADKGIADELTKNRDSLEPMRISGVAPTNPNLRAVIRPGQPEVQKANVDVEFEDLVKIGGDE